MRKVSFLLLCLILFASYADAQVRRNKVRRNYLSRMQRIGEFSYTGGAGISTYFGDLKQTVELWAKPSIGGAVNYRLSQKFSLRGELLWYRISGADSLNAPKYTIYDRNLSFRADNFELNVTAIRYLYNKYSRYERPILNPYAFAGIGLTTNNPEARYQGEWYDLRPLETEGVSYSPVALVVPFGLGITYHDVFPQFDLSLELGYRYTFTDYLDDASTVYPEASSFTNPMAAELSDRRDEFMQRVGRAPRYEGPLYRGNPSNNDWYLISSFKVTYTPGAPTARRYRRAKF